LVFHLSGPSLQDARLASRTSRARDGCIVSAFRLRRISFDATHCFQRVGANFCWIRLVSVLARIRSPASGGRGKGEGGHAARLSFCAPIVCARFSPSMLHPHPALSL
jgi:hypothetical protein